MKINFGNSIITLIAGLIIVLVGVFLNLTSETLSNPVVFAGLAISFLGTIFTVLSLNLRRKKRD